MRNETHYLDTRGLDSSRPTFSSALVKGIAPGGGLFVPEHLPSLSLEEISAFAEWPYWRRAAAVFSLFGVDMSAERIDALTQAAYGDQWDDDRVAPVVEVRADMHVLELWHGPTSAFKDMALQCMPLFFSESIEILRARGKADDDYLILVATSGDTGKAALEGFSDRDHTRIVVFYPVDGVSDVQRKQMVTQAGDNVGVFGVRGNFDDCQYAVKAVFANDEFEDWLRENHGLRLSSANSINWGRLLPQIVYYVSAYADMIASGAVKPGEPMDVCVPTGNFGNILGAYYARLMGVPIERLICASNENSVLAEFINTGLYDISEREFVTTPSPSMDILISSNLERLLFHLAGPPQVREWMGELATRRSFRVDRDTFETMREVFVGDWVDNQDALAAVRDVFEETGYLMDPHTAVAWEVAERMRGANPVLIVSTAHWAKFGADVLRALKGVAYGDPLPPEYDGMSGFDLLAQVQEIVGDGCACVPESLASLAMATDRFGDVVDAGREGVERAVREWLG
ncbi:MAG: threonine synthase [Actinobacteria bacterium]|nr:threonine synthase [Actinomycetota bacterium]MCG2808406.1 threonine synthase [Coriobacteriia bacterium]